MTRAKPTCRPSSKAPKQRECSMDWATVSRGIPRAQYEVVRKPWITSRSSRERSVVTTILRALVSFIPPLLPPGACPPPPPPPPPPRLGGGGGAPGQRAPPPLARGGHEDGVVPREGARHS